MCTLHNCAISIDSDSLINKFYNFIIKCPARDAYLHMGGILAEGSAVSVLSTLISSL